MIDRYFNYYGRRWLLFSRKRAALCLMISETQKRACLETSYSTRIYQTRLLVRESKPKTFNMHANTTTFVSLPYLPAIPKANTSKPTD